MLYAHSFNFALKKKIWYFPTNTFFAKKQSTGTTKMLNKQSTIKDDIVIPGVREGPAPDPTPGPVGVAVWASSVPGQESFNLRTTQPEIRHCTH